MSSGLTQRVLYRHEDLGRIFVPQDLAASVSLPDSPTHSRYGAGEVGIFVATQKRPVFIDGHMHSERCVPETCPWREFEARMPWRDIVSRYVTRYELVWASITHNERVNNGAAAQANRVFGAAGVTANGVFTALAVASATLTKTATDLSLGSGTAGVTTNEFTTLGLARALSTLGAYTAPASLGAQFSQVLTKTYTATGTATAYGGGVFDSVTPAGSNLIVEDNFSSSANLVTNDTLTEQVTYSN